MYEKINTTKTSTAIVEQILDLIEQKKLKPGDKLPPETYMMKMFGVGRSSVREAKQVLAAKHIIKIVPGQGSFIREIGEEYFDSRRLRMLIAQETLHEIHEVREILEVRVAGLAAERATTEDLEEMRNVIMNMEKRIALGLDIYDEGMYFHQALAKAAHNKVLLKVFYPLVSMLHEFQEPMYRKLSDPKKEFEVHKRIYEGVANGTPDQAEALMSEHLQFVKELMFHGSEEKGAGA